ncbi:hypothetical protein PIB30_076635 [Stylosanthes scabra]|uniref:Ribonuclease H1 N-terminal domain-containing protein n=1 Tax=Stylosanthes scabra TaxID=79078 RepID=A0ABU6RQ65_9FABA|nr:hypothetical protein [Stylosanthes scabra]
MSRAKYSHYVVRVGRVPGIYLTWEECDKQVHGYPFASFKGFKSLEEAQTWMNNGSGSGRGKHAAKGPEQLSQDFYFKIGGDPSSGIAYQIPVNSTQKASASTYRPSGPNDYIREPAKLRSFD